jgi:hypothetical protein
VKKKLNIFKFLPFKKNEDDIYLIPTICVGCAITRDGVGAGIGIKFLKIIFLVVGYIELFDNANRTQ